ncbi:helix-turn-helix domain-containing protein [Thermomonospora echinospora]|uniref:hypothetical protein n=1 Tax=Thermomonospora echinospora TaxID=1992 RepID=UPI0011B09EB5|nr:hypothetical protein [Thermomonospora echinospora]
MTEIVPAPRSPLQPLPPDLSPEVRDWATELRSLFAATGLSVSRFARVHHIDKGTVSRYLSGQRVPRDQWLLDALATWYDDNGRPLTSAVREHLAELQLRALEVAHPQEYRVRKVTDELEQAVIRLREVERHARDLEERVRRLTADRERLRAAWAEDRVVAQAEIDRLTGEIADLTEELERIREQGVRAELRCRALEALLDRIEQEEPTVPVTVAQAIEDVDGLDTASRVLTLAQQTADQAITESRREADEMLHRAKVEAMEILRQARSAAARIIANPESRPSDAGHGAQALPHRPGHGFGRLSGSHSDQAEDGPTLPGT